MGEALITRRGGGGKFERFETIITATGSVSIPCSGLYRITAIGKGAAGGYTRTYNSLMETYEYSIYAGGCGGGGYLETNISKGATLSVSLASSYIAASLNGKEIIRATNANAGTSGTSSGNGVIAFSSNNKTTTSIVPPACYNSDRYISKGGEGGSVANGTSSTASKNGGDGGNGLFGGDAPMAGHYILSAPYSYAPPVATAQKGAGQSGLGSAVSGTATTCLGGGGGGGGYGGGGGKTDRGGSYSNPRFGNFGGGGAACVFIERIG